MRNHAARMILVLWLTIATVTCAHATVELADRQGNLIPIKELHFIDENSKPVKLSDYSHGNTPLLISLVYYGCPGVCTQVLSGVFEGLRNTGLNAGKAFESVVISIDPDEHSGLALQKRLSYLREYGFGATATGFHFLVGEQTQISELASALGFHYERLGKTGQFQHPAALFVLSPDGHLVKTLSGARFTARGLRLVIARASSNEPSSVFERMMNACTNRLPVGNMRQWPARLIASLAAMLP